jgi:diguanylate cyclase (GGDEF)-like protein
MRSPLFRALFPRYEGEERALHLRLVRLVLRSWLAVLVIWLLAGAAVYLTGGMPGGPALVGAVFSAVFSGVVLGLGYLLTARDRVVWTGYLLAAAAMAFPLGNVLINPATLYLIAPLSIISVFIAGAAISPAAGYLFAAIALGTDAAAWLRMGQPPDLGVGDFRAGMVFLIVQGAVLFLAAAILHSYSRHAGETIRQLNRQTEQMTQLAHTDSLTGLANRRWLLELLEREFLRARRYRRPLSLVYLDLDGFKAVNDAFGHLFGDGILRSAARSMQAVLRGSDILARIGGDEFAVLLPETDLNGAEMVATKLRRALLSATRPYGASIPPLTFSAGICRLHDDDRTIDDLLARADEAQYLAKGSERGSTRTELALNRRAPADAAPPTDDGADSRT